MLRRSFLTAAVVTLAMLFAAPRAQAQAPLPTPTGPVILTVSGAIAHTNVGDTAQFDLAALQALGIREFRTATNWTEGEHLFTGVPLEAVLEAVGAQGTSINATAINDYAVQIPVGDARAGGPILAYAMDGAVLTRRSKGPLWVVYPYDLVAEYRSEVIFARSIWQLDRLELVE